MLSHFFCGRHPRPASGVFVRTIAVLTLAWLTTGTSPLMAQTWTQVKVGPLTRTGNLLLLSDGTVMVQGAEKSKGTSSKWAKLVPDAAGNYASANATWSSAAAMKTERAHFSSWVLPDGRLVVLGGQFYLDFLGFPTNWSNTVEIYNPQLDAWTTSTASYPGSALADSPSILLPNGLIAVGDFFSKNTFVYDPTADTWTSTGTRFHTGELWVTGESWTLLPDGSVISYDNIGSSSSTANSERFLNGSWTDGGVLPPQPFGTPASTSQLTDSSYNRPSNGGALGPASLLPNGQVIQFGANGLSAVYDPGTSTWIAGPSFPLTPPVPPSLVSTPPTRGMDSTAGAMLPNGLFFVVADTLKGQKNPTKLYTYDYTYAPNNPLALVNITPVSPASLATDLGGSGGLFRRTLMLPNGKMLLATGNGPVWEYTPATVNGTPDTTWRPTVDTLIIKNTSTSYTINGKRLTGISAGATFGGGFNNSASNYPIIRLKNNANGLVKYARSTNWTPGVANAGDLAVQSVDFELPTGFGAGNYTLNVVTNGIFSADKAFNVVNSPNYVTVLYDSANQIVTLTGDTDNNNVAISVKNQDLIFTGSGNTQIIYNGLTAASQKIHFGTNLSLAVALTIKGTFLGGKDYVTLTGVQVKKVTLDLGSGDDTCKVFYSNILSCTINGGLGFDTFGQAASFGGYFSTCEANFPP